jgi:hypothetical protein
VIYNNPFQPFLAVDNDDTPVKSRQAKAFDPFAPFTSRTRNEMAARALEQAEKDLEGARNRASGADEKRREKLEREGTLAERERIKTILTSPIAARQPRLAEAYAFKSDDSAAKAIAMMESADRDAAQSGAKSTADLIVLAGQMRRGEVAAPMTGAGPKVFVKTTAEEIIKAGKKARGED